MRPRAAFSKNRLMKGQIFRKFQWFCWFFSKRTISRESWRAAEKNFKSRVRPAGSGLADAVLNSLIFGFFILFCTSDKDSENCSNLHVFYPLKGKLVKHEAFHTYFFVILIWNFVPIQLQIFFNYSTICCQPSKYFILFQNLF